MLNISQPEKIMRKLNAKEIESVAGGVDFSSGPGYMSAWDSSLGISVTVTAELNTNNSTTFTLYANVNGEVMKYSANSAEQLGKILVGSAVGATIVGLGGGPLIAAAAGMIASRAYGNLWETSSRDLLPPFPQLSDS